MKAVQYLFRMNYARAGFVAGILLFIFFLGWNVFQVDTRAMKVLAVAALMITWWITEALPMPAVALLPLVFFPLLQVTPLKEVAASYGDSIIFLFMGGFLIGLAIEKWNLHKRIALSIVSITGTSGDRIILGFILATGFLSMWLSNTATTMMMYPIAASVIHVIRENDNGKAHIQNFSLSLMLVIAYASNFGGIGTIIGTPPNVAFAGFIQEKYGYTLQFVDWAIIAMPISLLLLAALYFVTTQWLYPSHLSSDLHTRQLIRQELAQLGPLQHAERRVLYVFSATALLWITKDLINMVLAQPRVSGWLGTVRLDDTLIALMGAISLFMIPVGGKGENRRQHILEWSDTSRMAWGILLLFGGGIALAAALEKAGVIQLVGNRIASFSGQGGLVLILAITFVSLFISEVMSNIAQVIVFAPVMAGIADALGINPLLLGLPMTLAASCASMMPMGTPPNAIVFASGHIRLGQMARAGLVMNLVAIILITLFSWLLIPWLIPEIR